ncbi:hypothetical protein LTR97_006813 [Elasticomyces elasticus]|uniref:Uncharacterized protein n=1 Tax=Elasticomyces elasticus TaxID=574655 RepID=A0AAN7W9M1_9PEZI|nr:hypothetical protein LTR97_006813 [Elasticomyces elasticus]
MQVYQPARTAESGNEQLDDDDDLDTIGELGGIGSKRKAEDDDIFDGLKRKKLSSEDKLLEQLIGKKAAQARKKSQEASRTTSRFGVRPQAKPFVVRKQDVESEDEEEGRAASFKSRKAKQRAVSTVSEVEVESGKLVQENGEDENAEDISERAKEVSPPPAKKRKGGSYLDELLGQKAAEKSKKKKKKHSGDPSSV